MKVLFLVCLLVIAPMVFGQCSNGTIWSQLGGTDAQRLSNLQFAVTRAFGIIVSDECNGYHFSGAPSNLGAQFIAFTATVIGGNINGTNNNNSAIAYRERGISSNPIITSNDLAGLLAALNNVHQPLGFSQQEQNAFKAALAAVLASAGLPACLVTQFGALLTATDSVIVGNGGTLSRACQTASARITWRNPITTSADISVNETVCFDWADTAPHTVNDTNTPAVGIAGFGYADLANSITINNASSCTTRGLTAGPCYLGSGFSYCIRFPAAGTFTFNCGVHSNLMQATVTVSASAGTTTTTGSASGTSTTGSGGSGSAASTLRPAFIF